MSEGATIKCPSCKTEFKLTEKLAAPIVEAAKERFREHLNRERAKLAERETKVQEDLLRLDQDRASLDGLVEARLVQERTRIAEDEARKAQSKIGPSSLKVPV